MRTPRVDKNGLKQGVWSAEEDRKLIDYINRDKVGNWSLMPKFAGLSRNGKSCRLRWVNYLNPDIKRGNITKEEEDIIVDMYAKLGSRWSTIAARLPGRTDNEIKNYWHTHLKKRSKEKLRQMIESQDIEIPKSEANAESSDGSNNITPASAPEASNSQGSGNQLPVAPYMAVDNECSFSSTASARGIGQIQELDEGSIDPLKTIGDSHSFWNHPFIAGNFYLENEQEAFVREWYNEPLSLYKFLNNEY